MFCRIEDLATESDIEQKLLHPMLTREDGLNFLSLEVKTKSYLPPLDIDKGAGKKKGYIPDYVVYIASIPVLVIEAKSPDEAAENGFREGQLYAHELNKRFPSGTNPVLYVIGCNGQELLYGTWDSALAKALSFEEINSPSAAFEEVRRLCCRSALVEHALSVRRALLPGFQYHPLTMLGGPAVQNRELPPNAFAQDLVPLLKRYLGPEAKENLDVLKRGYVPSSEITKYNEVLETLLKDNLARARTPAQIELKTMKNNAPDFERQLKSALQSGSAESQILIIGNVGVGKSMFLERFYHFLQDDELRSSTAWCILDFNKAPNSMDRIEEWICSQFVEEFPKRNALPNFLDINHLERYFAPELMNRKRGPYANLMVTQPDEYERRIADDLARWVENAEQLTAGIIRYYQSDCGTEVVVAFDNVDRRDRDQQLRIFQAIQWFRSKCRCFTITCLRDETYDRHRREPPLDAIYPLLVFRVNPPRFLDVGKRRVELALEYLGKNVTEKQRYLLPSGAAVEYPGTRVGEFLIAVYVALFKPARMVRLLLEAIAGRDVRRALQMFTDN